MNGPSPAPATTPVAHRPRWPWRLLAGIHVVAVLLLCVAAYRLHGAHCENFGCIGTGIAWFAWACTSALTLCAGLVARRRLAGTAGSRVTGLALGVQLLACAWLLGRWLAAGPLAAGA